MEKSLNNQKPTTIIILIKLKMTCSTGITSFKRWMILAFDQSTNSMKTNLNRKILSQAQMYLISISQQASKKATIMYYLS